jgi:hypothetical protein
LFQAGAALPDAAEASAAVLFGLLLIFLNVGSLAQAVCAEDSLG